MTRSSRRRGLTLAQHRRRRLGRRTVLAVVVVAALAATAASVQQLRDQEERKEVADAAAVDARAGRDDVAARSADLEAVIRRLDERAAGRRDTTAYIEETVADIDAMRTAVDGLLVSLADQRADRAARQGKIDLLLGCRDTLASAEDQLGTGPATPAGASALLDRGRSQCQVALELVQGDTGAVHPYDFPDPSILLVGDTYYAYGTEGPGGSIQVLTSTDLRSWTVRPTALANLPAWARDRSTWAPTVHPNGDHFVLYYAARSRISGNLCVSTAIGLTPAGPFLDDSKVPLVCQDGLGGSIDPSVYVDELGFAHLMWKSEDETVGGQSHLWAQFLGADGRSVLGLPGVLLRAEQPWEDEIIENPSMVKVGGSWVLLYSGNRWNTADYAIGHAVCASANGPCQRPTRPILRASTGGYQGPGGAFAFTSRGGQHVVAFAAWDEGQIGFPNPRRLHLAKIVVRDDLLSLEDL